MKFLIRWKPKDKIFFADFDPRSSSIAITGISVVPQGFLYHHQSPFPREFWAGSKIDTNSVLISRKMT